MTKVLAGLLLYGFAGALNASVIGFSHSQTTLGEELLATVHCTIYPCPLTTRIFEIFNESGTVWTDYHLRLESNRADGEDDDATGPTFLNLDAITMFSEQNYSGALGEFYNGSVPLAASFLFESAVHEIGDDNALETYDVYGRPSYVPVPSTVALFILGLIALRRERSASKK